MIDENLEDLNTTYLDSIGFSIPFNVDLLDEFKNKPKQFTAEAVVFLNEVSASSDLDQKTLCYCIKRVFQMYFSQIAKQKKPVQLNEFIHMFRTKYPYTNLSVEDCIVSIKVFKVDETGKAPNAASKYNMKNKDMYIPEVYTKFNYNEFVSHQDEVLPSSEV